MIERLMGFIRPPVTWGAAGVVLAAIVGLPPAAQARVWIGLGFPFYAGPPAYYYPPPAYYPPPPVSYGPPAQYPLSSQSCIVQGMSVCPMDRPVAPGAFCYCTTSQGRIWGRAT